MTDVQKEQMAWLEGMKASMSPDEYERTRKAIMGEDAPSSAQTTQVTPAPQATPAPSAPQQDLPEWYIGKEGQPQGPYSKERLGDMLIAGDIIRTTLVWKSSMGTNWAAVETVAELADILAELPPPAPVASPVPAAAPTSGTAEWRVVVNGAQMGPYTAAKLGEMLEANEVDRQSLVWKKGMANWAAMEAVAELADIVANAPPPVPDAAPAPSAPAASAPEYSFLMPIDDAFASPGRGTIVTGTIERGVIELNAAVEIVGNGFTKKTVATGIEKLNKQLNKAVAGENVGVVLRGIDKAEIQRGMKLVIPAAASTPSASIDPDRLLGKFYYRYDDANEHSESTLIIEKPDHAFCRDRYERGQSPVLSEYSLSVSGLHITLAEKYNKDRFEGDFDPHCNVLKGYWYIKDGEQTRLYTYIRLDAAPASSSPAPSSSGAPFTGRVNFDYTHKEVKNGRGQFAKVIGYIEPCMDADYDFANKTFGGAIPKTYIPACSQGFREAANSHSVYHIRCVLTDGKSHPVDSSEAAFKAAAAAAFEQAFNQAKGASTPAASPTPSAPAASSAPSAPKGMVRIEGGAFMMGSPKNEPGRSKDEGPQHEVTLSPFYMGIYPVTQGEWKKVVGKLPSHIDMYVDDHIIRLPGRAPFVSGDPTTLIGDNLPITYIMLTDVIKYCNALSKREGLTPVYPDDFGHKWNRDANGYRLPTEAEWEYACRAGTTSAYNTGESLSTDTGWYKDNWGVIYNGRPSAQPHPVGGKPANAWGLYDMHGNVQERCWDHYGDYPKQPMTNPAGPADDLNSDRVVRGGSYYSEWQELRSAARRTARAVEMKMYIGFRLVRNV